MFKYELSNIEMRVINILWINEKDGLTAGNIRKEFEQIYKKKHFLSEFERILSELLAKEYVITQCDADNTVKYFCKYSKEEFLHKMSRMFVRRYFFVSFSCFPTL